MDMREAFEHECNTNPKAENLTDWGWWQAACEWQKQKDAEICNGMDKGSVDGLFVGRMCADVILNQGKGERRE